jgi:hypothetical protein
MIGTADQKATVTVVQATDADRRLLRPVAEGTGIWTSFPLIGSTCYGLSMAAFQPALQEHAPRPRRRDDGRTFHCTGDRNP